MPQPLCVLFLIRRKYFITWDLNLFSLLRLVYFAFLKHLEERLVIKNLYLSLMNKLVELDNLLRELWVELILMLGMEICSRHTKQAQHFLVHFIIIIAPLTNKGI